MRSDLHATADALGSLYTLGAPDSYDRAGAARKQVSSKLHYFQTMLKLITSHFVMHEGNSP